MIVEINYKISLKITKLACMSVEVVLKYLTESKKDVTYTFNPFNCNNVTGIIIYFVMFFAAPLRHIHVPPTHLHN